MDGDTAVGLGDFKKFATEKFSLPPGSPGPSGLPCAGQTSCASAGLPISAGIGGLVEVFQSAFSNGNPPAGQWGSVAVTFLITATEITNAQYAEFLNAVASEDPNGLYSPDMSGVDGGISRAETNGVFSYASIAGRENWPVNFVSLYDAFRFANWHFNLRPIGPQDGSTTEDGAYSISPAAIAANTIVRNVTASVFIPTENEWFKAAYYEASTSSYFSMPTTINQPPTCSAPGAQLNSYNCGNANGLTDVGGYTGTRSAYGTYDQGGNVMEWTESIDDGDLSHRVVRGGAFDSNVLEIFSSRRTPIDPSTEAANIGFRVATYDRCF